MDFYTLAKKSIFNWKMVIPFRLKILGPISQFFTIDWASISYRFCITQWMLQPLVTNGIKVLVIKNRTIILLDTAKTKGSGAKLQFRWSKGSF